MVEPYAPKARRPESRNQEKYWESFLSLSRGVRFKDISSFTRQFAVMNSAGLPLIQCLDTILEQTDNRILKKTIQDLSSDVQAGASLADAMSRHPRIFSRLYCAMVRAGETGGILGGILVRLADYQEKAVALRRKITGAMTYPVMVSLVAAGVVMALLVFVVPAFSRMLSELGAGIPAPTRLIMDASELIKQWLPLAAGLPAAALVFLVFLYRKNENVRRAVDTVRLKVPVFGNLEKKSAVSKFSRTLGALLAGGVPLAGALEITAKTTGNLLLERTLMKTLEAIKGGRTFAATLKETGVFPPMVIQMIAVGEKTGGLPDMLARIADFYEAELNTAVTSMTAVIEPVMIVIMAVIIGAVLIAMYLPMFEMISAIG